MIGGRSLVRLGLLALVGILVALPVRVGAEEAKGLSPEQVDSVREIIRDYLLENPEIIFEAIDALREKQRLAQEELVRQTLAARHDELYNDADAPVAGNPEGDVTVVEFFDYKCPYCKRVAKALLDTVEEDGGIRLVFKEFPILGPVSVYAARAALAARNQDKYLDFHTAMMQARVELTESVVMRLATAVGLDPEKLERDMAAPELDAILARNHGLAQDLFIDGTPTFVIGDRVVPGAIKMATFKILVATARDAETDIPQQREKRPYTARWGLSVGPQAPLSTRRDMPDQGEARLAKEPPGESEDSSQF